MSYDYDVIIIGSGPAGFSCAIQSSKFGKRVLIVEANPENLGGSWINTGTVPSKSLREAAKLIQKFHTQFADQEKMKPYQRFKMSDILRYKQSILSEKNRKVKNDLIKHNIETARGRGKLLDGHTVEVTLEGGRTITYTAGFVMISTGSRPGKPEQFEVDHHVVVDYRSILELTHIPRRLVIVGGGVIALEFATIFAALGTRITILSAEKGFLPFLDEEVSGELHKILRKKTIQLTTECSIERVEKNDFRTSMEVFYRTASEPGRLQVVETDHVLHVGHKMPNSEGLGLAEIGVGLSDRNTIEVDEAFRTAVPSVFAAGDVIGFPSQASASFVQGRIAACAMFGMGEDEIAANVPYGIYSIPEIAGIGLTEADARRQGIHYKVGKISYSNLTQADIGHVDDGMLKMIFDADTLRILGVHIIGEQASDLIHLGQCVMQHGGTIEYFLKNVLNYPSYGEAYRMAAFDGLTEPVAE